MRRWDQRGRLDQLGATRGWVVGSVLGAGLALALASPDADACSMAAPAPSFVGLPQDGSADVPTDVVPIYSADLCQLFDFVGQAATFQLSAAEGETIALAPRQSHAGHFELVPEHELQPLTAYTLGGHWKLPYGTAEDTTVTLSFTTGAGPSTSPEPLVASMRHYATDANQGGGDCRPYPSGTCVFFPAGTGVEVTEIDSFGQEIRWGGYAEFYDGPFMTDLSGINQATNFVCLNLKRRAYNGALGPVLTLCGSDAPLDRLHGLTDIACTPDGPSYQALESDWAYLGEADAGVPSDGGAQAEGTDPSTGSTLRLTARGGCAFGPGETRTRATGLAALALLGSILLRRRKRAG
jgi:hypothetical protein